MCSYVNNKTKQTSSLIGFLNKRFNTPKRKKVRKKRRKRGRKMPPLIL